MNEQQRLLNAIWNEEPAVLAESGFDSQGINIYRRNLLANAQRALTISFPTIFALLDSDISDSLTQQFLRQYPPSHGDWAQWGECFDKFIATTQVADDYPYFPDCATVDWHIHCALQGKDQTLDQASLSLLQSSEPENIVVEFNTNVSLVKTIYPLTEIYQAHHGDKIQREVAMKQAKSALSSPLQEHVVMIYRPEFQPQVTRLTHSESEFILCLHAGNSLVKSLDTVSHFNDFSFELWLLKAIEQNLIYLFREQ